MWVEWGACFFLRLLGGDLPRNCCFHHPLHFTELYVKSEVSTEANDFVVRVRSELCSQSQEGCLVIAELQPHMRNSSQNYMGGVGCACVFPCLLGGDLPWNCVGKNGRQDRSIVLVHVC